MNYEELSSAVGTETKAEALAKGKELLKAMKFGKWEVRCWARRISADKDAWHYELVMVGAPLRLFLGGSQGRSASHCSFYVTTSVPALSFTLGYDKEYRDPNDAVKFR